MHWIQAPLADASEPAVAVELLAAIAAAAFAAPALEAITARSKCSEQTPEQLQQPEPQAVVAAAVVGRMDQEVMLIQVLRARTCSLACCTCLLPNGCKEDRLDCHREEDRLPGVRSHLLPAAAAVWKISAERSLAAVVLHRLHQRPAAAAAAVAAPFVRQGMGRVATPHQALRAKSCNLRNCIFLRPSACKEDRWDCLRWNQGPMSKLTTMPDQKSLAVAETDHCQLHR